jgi:hypothetical protein
LNSARAQVQLEIAEAERADLGTASLRRRGRLGAPQDAAHARQQLPRTEGFRQIVIGPELEPHDPVGLVPHSRQHDDGNGGLTAQGTRDGHAVLARQAQVQHNQIDRRLREDGRHLGTARGRADTQAVLGEILGEERADAGVVVDDEDVRLNRFGHDCYPSCRCTAM